ncbi:hypothetical protein HK102_001572 [Quaeritorhiza haematococci]|nr:hypothetical protein HK102_001572 [Quaeritorhiza haematococci]
MASASRETLASIPEERPGLLSGWFGTVADVFAFIVICTAIYYVGVRVDTGDTSIGLKADPASVLTQNPSIFQQVFGAPQDAPTAVPKTKNWWDQFQGYLANEEQEPQDNEAAGPAPVFLNQEREQPAPPTQTPAVVFAQPVHVQVPVQQPVQLQEPEVQQAAAQRPNVNAGAQKKQWWETILASGEEDEETQDPFSGLFNKQKPVAEPAPVEAPKVQYREPEAYQPEPVVIAQPTQPQVVQPVQQQVVQPVQQQVVQPVQQQVVQPVQQQIVQPQVVQSPQPQVIQPVQQPVMQQQPQGRPVEYRVQPVEQPAQQRMPTPPQPQQQQQRPLVYQPPEAPRMTQPRVEQVPPQQPVRQEKAQKPQVEGIWNILSNLLPEEDIDPEATQPSAGSKIPFLASQADGANDDDGEGSYFAQFTSRGSCVAGYYGIDETHDSWCAANCPLGKCPASLCACGLSEARGQRVVCADNNYVTLPGKTFLCQASCNQPPFHCPVSQCACANNQMTSSQRCFSPRICKTADYVAVPGTIATNEWCNSTCNAATANGASYCPCTLCQCAVTCTPGIANGDFEKGLMGWNMVRQIGSTSNAPVVTHPAGSGSDVPSPFTGKEIAGMENYVDNMVALMDHASPGSYVMYQEYVPARGDVLSFNWLVENWANDFYIQSETLSANVFRNQQFRVDLVEADTSEWFTATGGAGPKLVLANILSPERVRAVMNAMGRPPYSLVNPWQSLKFDLTPFSGRRVWIAFRAVHNQGVMNVAIDNVKILNKICSPAPYGNAGPIRPKMDQPTLMEYGNPSCGDVCTQMYA